MKKIILTIFIFICTIFISGCSKSNVEKINYKEFQELINDKETFILYISSTECHNCTEFSPKLESVIEKYNINDVKKIEIDSLSEEDKDKFNEIINVSGTPTVAFIIEGEEESMANRINGNVDKDKIVSRLKSNGYITK